MYLEPPGLCLLGDIWLNHMQGLCEAAGKGTDVVPHPVRLQLLSAKVDGAIPVVNAHL